MAFKALNILLLRKCDTLSMLLGSIIVTDENKQLGINIWRLGKIIFQLPWKVELSLVITFVI